MATVARSIVDLAQSSLKIPDSRWYAVYTHAHQEKRVEQRLKIQHFKTFLPLYSRSHRRGTRRVQVVLPLFSGYVFARFPLQERIRVLSTSGVCRIVGKGSHPEPLSDTEVDGLLQASTSKIKAEPHSQLLAGRKVRIRTGPLEGLEGILIRRKGQSRVVISLNAIASAFVVDVDEYDVEPVTSWPKPSHRCLK